MTRPSQRREMAETELGRCWIRPRSGTQAASTSASVTPAGTSRRAPSTRRATNGIAATVSGTMAAVVPMDVPAITLNDVCLSGTEAVSQAARVIAAGEADVVLAIGQESMSLAPHVAPLRAGVKYGDATFVDTVDHDGLADDGAAVLARLLEMTEAPGPIG